VVVFAYFDQGYTGEQPKHDPAEQGIEPCVVKLPTAKKGFVLLPKRWVAERSFAWASRFRSLARDYRSLPQTLAGLYFIAFVCPLLARLPDALQWLGQSV
jgi:transposase